VARALTVSPPRDRSIPCAGLSTLRS
jgi:hypothetical protein